MIHQIVNVGQVEIRCLADGTQKSGRAPFVTRGAQDAD